MERKRKRERERESEQRTTNPCKQSGQSAYCSA